MDSAETVASVTTKPEIAILFFGVALILGALCKQVFARTPVPYTVALLIIGIVLGVLGEQLATASFISFFMQHLCPPVSIASTEGLRTMGLNLDWV